MFKHKHKQTFIILPVLLFCRILSVSGQQGNRSNNQKADYSSNLKRFKPATSDDIDTLLSDLDLGPDDLQEAGGLYKGQHDSLDLGSDDVHQPDDLEQPGFLYQGQDDLHLNSDDLLDLEKQPDNTLRVEDRLDVLGLPPDFQMTDYVIPGDDLIQDEGIDDQDINKLKDFLPDKNYSPKQNNEGVGFEESDSKGEMVDVIEEGMVDIIEGGMEDNEMNGEGLKDVMEGDQQYIPLNKDKINSTANPDFESVKESEYPEIQPALEESKPDKQDNPFLEAEETTEISTIPSTKPENITTPKPSPLPEENKKDNKMIGSYKSEGKNESDPDIEKMKETVLNDKLGMELLSVVEQIQEMQKEIADVLND